MKRINLLDMAFGAAFGFGGWLAMTSAHADMEHKIIAVLPALVFASVACVCAYIIRVSVTGTEDVPPKEHFGNAGRWWHTLRDGE